MFSPSKPCWRILGDPVDRNKSTHLVVGHGGMGRGYRVEQTDDKSVLSRPSRLETLHLSSSHYPPSLVPPPNTDRPRVSRGTDPEHSRDRDRDRLQHRRLDRPVGLRGRWFSTLPREVRVGAGGSNDLTVCTVNRRRIILWEWGRDRNLRTGCEYGEGDPLEGSRNGGMNLKVRVKRREHLNNSILCDTEHPLD